MTESAWLESGLRETAAEHDARRRGVLAMLLNDKERWRLGTSRLHRAHGYHAGCLY